MPPSIQRSNAEHYKAEGTITEVKEYEGRSHLMPSQQGWEEVADYDEGRSHLMPSQQGWEEVADYALTWATEHALAWATRRSVPSTA